MNAPYQVMPELTRDEYLALRADIEENGIAVPIIVDESGIVIDGHHRAEIADALGIDCPVEVVAGLSEAAKLDLALRVNINRRSLSREQKRELLANAIKATPEQSNRQIAERVGVDHKTVGAVRDQLEDGGEIPHHEERVGKDGVTQPASKAHINTTTRVSEATKVEHDVDTETGEILDSPAAVIAQALEDSKRDPAHLAQKAFERFHDALKTIDAAGGLDEIEAACSVDGIRDDGRYLRVLERVAFSANTWASNIRRRNIRSVK